MKKRLRRTKWLIPPFGQPQPHTHNEKQFARRIFSKKSDAENAKYIGTALTLEDFKKHHTNSVEFAVIGRSNAGKSTLINNLLGLTGSNNYSKKNRAAVSNTPGKTKLANFFGLHETSWKGRSELPEYGAVFVDLPGYGYAKGDKTRIKQMDLVYDNYFDSRDQDLRFGGAIVLVDARRGFMTSDDEILEYLAKAGVSVQLVLTKIDLVKPEQLEIDAEKNRVRDPIVAEMLRTLETGKYMSVAPEALGVSSVIKTVVSCLGFKELKYAIARTVLDRSTDRAKDLFLKRK